VFGEAPMRGMFIIRGFGAVKQAIRPGRGLFAQVVIAVIVRRSKEERRSRPWLCVRVQERFEVALCNAEQREIMKM
jgi:hypothetical protein